VFARWKDESSEWRMKNRAFVVGRTWSIYSPKIPVDVISGFYNSFTKNFKYIEICTPSFGFPATTPT